MSRRADETTAASAPSAGRRPRGRPPRTARSGDSPGTREQILTAARGLFAEHGYDRATVRGIATAAGVDPALVHHYFGTKEQVFRAAVSEAIGPLLEAVRSITPEPGTVGAQLVRAFLGAWEDPVTRGPLIAMARSALTHDNAGRVFRDFVVEHLAQRVAAMLEAPDALLRVQFAASHLLGTALFRYVLLLEPLASLPVDEVAARLTPVVRFHLTAPFPADASHPAGERARD